MKKLDWRALLGFGLSAALLYWVFSRIEFDKVAHELRTASLPLFLLSVAVVTTTFAIRARKWRTILDPVQPGIAYGPLWRATTVGMMVNNVAPARLGEIARAYVLVREVPAVPLAASLASLMVDRLFDAVVLMLLLFMSMFDPSFPAGARIGGQPASHVLGGWGTIALLVVLATLYGIAVFPARIVSLFELFARRLAPSLEQRGREALLAFSQGLGVLRSPRRFGAVFAWTVLHWLVSALAFWIAFHAVGIRAPFAVALFLQGLIAIGVAVPSTPGFFGVFEAAAVMGLSGVYGYDRAQALSWAVGYHVLSFIPITLIGAYYFARLGLKFGDFSRAADGAVTSEHKSARAARGRPADGE